MKKFLITALALVLVTVAASAQNNRNRQRMNPAEMYTTMAENLAKQLKLKKEKAETFKLLYVDYQNARRAAQGSTADFTSDLPDVKKMTDEEANQLIADQFAAQEKQLAVDKEFLPKFLDLLTIVCKIFTGIAVINHAAHNAAAKSVGYILKPCQQSFLHIVAAIVLAVRYNLIYYPLIKSVFLHLTTDFFYFCIFHF
jgi:rubrerythrin